MPFQLTMNSSCTKPLIKQHQKIIFKTKKSKTKDLGFQKQIKCVLVGDGAVGKTSLAVSYSTDTFPQQYVPTAFDNYKVTVEVDGAPVGVHLCDTAGQSELNELRGLCYPDADVFMLCFSVVQPASFKSARTRWTSELTSLNIPVILVGTQSDLRDDPATLHALNACGERPVSQADAQKLANNLNAPYIETSALTCYSLKDAFDQAIMSALKYKKVYRKPIWKRLCCFN